MASTYLDTILQAKRRSASQDHRSFLELQREAEGAPPTRGFRSSLAAASAVNLAVIAEIKRRSPSKGDLAPKLDPHELAAQYTDGGAACLSVLTDGDFFGGSASDLMAARFGSTLPVLRKDFTVSLHDVCDARIMGADCILLIVAALEDTDLRQFDAFARYLGLDVLVEVHDGPELERAITNTDADMIGVNQRDLVTFEVDTDRAVALAAEIPTGILKVAESGVRSPSDAEALAAAGYDAVLVGEHLVTSSDPGFGVSSLRVPRPNR